MKVSKCLTQIEAANDANLYCGKDKTGCPFKIVPIRDYENFTTSEKNLISKKNNIIIRRRNCRSNIIVDSGGSIKSFVMEINIPTLPQNILIQKYILSQLLKIQLLQEIKSEF